MVVTSTSEFEANSDSTYDRNTEVKAFEDSKAGVKGLFDSGLTKIPRMFYTDKLNLTETSKNDSEYTIPIIDFKELHRNSVLHTEIVDQIRTACQDWGFFQVINHGIPIEVLDGMITGIQKFHEQDTMIKKQFYSRESGKKVRYFSNVNLLQGGEANWRDSLVCQLAPNPPKPEEIPAICRYLLYHYNFGTNLSIY